MSRQLVREFQTAYPDVPVEPRVQEKTVESLDKLLSRLMRGERGAAGAVVVDERGFILLQRHDPATGWPPDAWAIPGGGVRPGESFEDAAEREALEETGLSVTVERPLLYLRQKFFSGKRTAEYPFIFYLARPKGRGRNPTPRKGEVVEARWFHSVPRTAFDREILVRLLKEVRSGAPAPGPGADAGPDEEPPSE